MERLIGNIDAKTDAKGRVFVPATFRKILQPAEDARLILRKDIYKDCLVLYPLNAWEAELAKLRERLDEYDEEQNDFYQYFLADSEVLEMDSNGRILIGKRYLKIANITNDVRFIGMGDTIRIWSHANFDEFMKQNNDTFKMNARKFLVK
ncbi:MAG: division/cell wall cluster transcriptional repressor MraZ [Candidatus Symbiothrix sp.]|jgi:MraZ protein|nr:division/cell wall cluster transcriptional repressor MraZ [Candidatus Symbiothrix sp.]